jgi:hypothetical protein
LSAPPSPPSHNALSLRPCLLQEIVILGLASAFAGDWLSSQTDRTLFYRRRPGGGQLTRGKRFPSSFVPTPLREGRNTRRGWRGEKRPKQRGSISQANQPVIFSLFLPGKGEKKDRFLLMQWVWSCSEKGSFYQQTRSRINRQPALPSSDSPSTARGPFRRPV